jgi:hypothetical protein
VLAPSWRQRAGGWAGGRAGGAARRGTAPAAPRGRWHSHQPRFGAPASSKGRAHAVPLRGSPPPGARARAPAPCACRGLQGPLHGVRGAGLRQGRSGPRRRGPGARPARQRHQGRVLRDRRGLSGGRRANVWRQRGIARALRRAPRAARRAPRAAPRRAVPLPAAPPRQPAPPPPAPPARAQAVAWLLGVPGASATVLEVAVPYCRDSLVSILGQVQEGWGWGQAGSGGRSGACRQGPGSEQQGVQATAGARASARVGGRALLAWRPQA